MKTFQSLEKVLGWTEGRHHLCTAKVVIFQDALGLTMAV